MPLSTAARNTTPAERECSSQIWQEVNQILASLHRCHGAGSISGLARRQGLACLSDIVHYRFLQSHPPIGCLMCWTRCPSRPPSCYPARPRACDTTSSLAAEGDLLRRGGFISPLPEAILASLHICTSQCYCYHTVGRRQPNKSIAEGLTSSSRRWWSLVGATPHQRGAHLS